MSAPVLTVCLVCTGNICRSPMADVVLRQMAATTPLADGSMLADHLEITSAGTSPWHAGEPMDPRAAAALHAHGYTDHGHVAQAFESAWFDTTDLVVCMARGHQQTLRGLARKRAGGGNDHEAKLVLLRSYDRRAGGAVDVPDPYYGDQSDFEACLALVEAGCRGLAEALAGQVAAELAGGQVAAQSKVTNDSAS